MPASFPDTPSAAIPAWVQSGRVPCLDGLRALAIAAVIYSHINERQNIGHMGVLLFFVISGFLITLLMLRENSRTGTLSLPDFYRRRTLRIVPALAFYMAFIFVLQKLGIVYILTKFWLAALTYTTCYLSLSNAPHTPGGGDLGHTWSLAVEEHFYLLWPVLFYFAKPQKAFKGLLGYLLLLPLLRFVVLRFVPAIDADFASVTAMGSIGLGCVAAYMVYGKAFPVALEKVRRSPNALLAVSVFFLIAQSLLGSAKIEALLHANAFFARWIGDPLSGIGFTLLLLYVVYLPAQSPVFRLLNGRVLVTIGALSYSVYLWQQPFTGAGVWANRSGWSAHWIFSLLLVVAFSLFSYYAIEVPFLRLKDHKKVQ